MMRALAWIDFHAADRIGDVRAMRVRYMVVRAMAVRTIAVCALPLPVSRMIQDRSSCVSLETYTREGYIGAMQANAKTSVTKRLKRIEGQVRGLARMVEDDRYCIDIVTQISAVRSALRRAEEEILADHIAHCVEHAIASGNKAEQRRKVSELIEVLSRSDR
jgi:DNA-binding FrmR family transcriptional regulator